MAHASELPEIAICQILQSLSTKFAVRASILSKQWERVWPLVPVLDFDEEENVHNGHYASPRRHRKFLEFVTLCLRRREEDKLLHKFWLCMAYCYYCKDCGELVDKCLSFALDRNVKELHIAESGYFLSHKDMLFSEDTRQTSCAPLPSLKHLDVKIMEPKTFRSFPMAVTDCFRRDSLNWMAPSLEILSIYKQDK